MTGLHIESIVLRKDTRTGINIEHAPPIAVFSLELIWQADPRELRVAGDLIHIAGQVTYRVIGWKDMALTAELVADHRQDTESNQT